MSAGWSERLAAEQLCDLAAEFDRLGEPDLATSQLALAAQIAPDTDLSRTPAFAPILLRNLPVGESAWCAPYTLAEGVDGKQYVCVDSDAYSRPFVAAGASMRVERRADGWHVWPGEKRYTCPHSPAPGFDQVAALHR